MYDATLAYRLKSMTLETVSYYLKCRLLFPKRSIIPTSIIRYCMTAFYLGRNPDSSYCPKISPEHAFPIDTDIDFCCKLCSCCG